MSGRFMVLDIGEVRLSVALSGALGCAVQPLLTLWRRNRGEDGQALLEAAPFHGHALPRILAPLLYHGVRRQELCPPRLRDMQSYQDFTR
jgi:hypothetical protein